MARAREALGYKVIGLVRRSSYRCRHCCTANIAPHSTGRRETENPGLCNGSLLGSFGHLVTPFIFPFIQHIYGTPTLYQTLIRCWRQRTYKVRIVWL